LAEACDDFSASEQAETSQLAGMLQQGTFSPASNKRMPSIGMDRRLLLFESTLAFRLKTK
jgi:hypothetical protein